MTFRVLLAMLFTTALLCLGGCDIAPEARIGDPINDGSDSDLDPTEPGNIAVFFYLDKPVVGLRFSCRASGSVPITGRTDDNGRFVCPRSTTASFYIGDPGEMKIGEVNLETFGLSGDADARNYVTITPATLVGTTADSDNFVVTNMFNLLTTLDGGITSGSQDVIRITEAVHEAFSPYSDTLDLESSPVAFGFQLGDIAIAIDAVVGVTLRQGGTALTDSQARTLADYAIMRSRSGMYHYLPPLSDTDDLNGKTGITSKFNLAVSRTGHMAGIALFQLIDVNVSPADYDIQLATLEDNSRFSVDGSLVHGAVEAPGLQFRSQTTSDLMEITGRLVNDWLYGDPDSLDPETNHRVPSSYVFDSSDRGYFTYNTSQFEAGASMYRATSNTPDVDLDELPLALLPRTIGLSYKGYPDGTLSTHLDGSPITDEERASSAYVASMTAHPLFFRILASGDIVSDVDFDCEEITEVAGDVEDSSGTQEYYIGQVGGIFKDDDGNPYITMLLAIYEPGHPDFGFTLGTGAIGRDSLTSVVYDVNRSELRSKSCNPADDPCEIPVEWFNDAYYYLQVYKPVLDLGLTDAADIEPYFRNDHYYGRVTLNADVCLTP